MEDGNGAIDYLSEYAKKCDGFFEIFQKVKTIHVKDGNYLGELEVSEEHVNAVKVLHGGLISALTDNFSCAALLSHKDCLGLINVTIAMHISILKSAQLNDVIVIDARTLEVGQNLGHVECQIRNKASNDIISMGETAMIIIRSKF